MKATKFFLATTPLLRKADDPERLKTFDLVGDGLVEKARLCTLMERRTKCAIGNGSGIVTIP